MTFGDVDNVITRFDAHDYLLDTGTASAIYLAVTLEKMGLSNDARPHWRAYQQLAPQGEWVALAKEFSE